MANNGKSLNFEVELRFKCTESEKNLLLPNCSQCFKTYVLGEL